MSGISGSRCWCFSPTCAKQGFIRQDAEVHYQVAEKIADIIPMLRAGTTLSVLEPVTDALIEQRF